MISIKHILWEIGEEQTDVECTYVRGTLYTKKFRMLPTGEIECISTQSVYAPLKYKEKKYKDVLGYEVTERTGTYEIDEEELK